MISRAALWARLAEPRRWDLVVVGGGATGLGVALDAAVRGLSVVLLESHDFASGTSSRTTKLAHGGVRYLAQGDLGLVREALHERGALLANAPHVAQRLGFVMPGTQWWQRAFYGIGLKAYDALAGRQGLGGTEWLDSAAVRALLPGLQPRGLWGGVRYWDGQFDDARLAVVLARTALARGAVVLNHAPVTGVVRTGGRVSGVQVRDAENGAVLTLQAQCVVSATGVWVDALRALDGGSGGEGGAGAGAGAGEAARADGSVGGNRPASVSSAPAPLVAPSQGVHLVVDRSFLPGTHALLVPRTADGRVLFAVPWLGKLVLGTTDTPRQDAPREPLALPAEVDFILREAGRMLLRPPTRADVRSVWVGLRPLVKPQAAAPGSSTQGLSREHLVHIAASGLVSVTGGKWTTYRSMAEDVLAQAMAVGLLPQRPQAPGGGTSRLPLQGAAPGRPLTEPPGEHLYGSDATLVRSLPGADHWLWRDLTPVPGGSPRGLSEAMVRFAARFEMARTVEDVLARRCRLLFLDAAEAARQADAVAAILAEETGLDAEALGVEAFKLLAAQYARAP